MAGLLVSALLFGQSQITKDQWREDVQYLKKTVHQDYSDLFVKTTPEEFNQAIGDLNEQIPNLEDHEIAVGMMRVVSLFKYGHTSIGTHGSIVNLHRLPINLYQFSDGV